MKGLAQGHTSLGYGFELRVPEHTPLGLVSGPLSVENAVFVGFSEQQVVFSARNRFLCPWPGAAFHC